MDKDQGQDQDNGKGILGIAEGSDGVVGNGSSGTDNGSGVGIGDGVVDSGALTVAVPYEDDGEDGLTLGGLVDLRKAQPSLLQPRALAQVGPTPITHLSFIQSITYVLFIHPIYYLLFIQPTRITSKFIFIVYSPYYFIYFEVFIFYSTYLHHLTLFTPPILCIPPSGCFYRIESCPR